MSSEMWASFTVPPSVDNQESLQILGWLQVEEKIQIFLALMKKIHLNKITMENLTVAQYPLHKTAQLPKNDKFYLVCIVKIKSLFQACFSFHIFNICDTYTPFPPQ